jgi:hypothetical protein
MAGLNCDTNGKWWTVGISPEMLERLYRDRLVDGDGSVPNVAKFLALQHRPQLHDGAPQTRLALLTLTVDARMPLQEGLTQHLENAIAACAAAPKSVPWNRRTPERFLELLGADFQSRREAAGKDHVQDQAVMSKAVRDFAASFPCPAQEGWFESPMDLVRAPGKAEWNKVADKIVRGENPTGENFRRFALDTYRIFLLNGKIGRRSS